MKIVAGIGGIEEYIPMVEAGADEVFCGFVPFEWNNRYGNIIPLNRREVLYYNIQISSYVDMKILKKMVEKYKVPVSIAFNSLYYLEEQYPLITNIIGRLIDVGFNRFIIADIGLILYLKKNNINCFIELSGECSELNNLSMNFFNQFDISRYIFHRKNTIQDMKSCINENSKKLEYEAFILNERCHFTGAYCNSLHCDELEHICKLPYIVTGFDNEDKLKQREKKLEEGYILGKTGCGLCNLMELKEAGVTHLKVVGRGNFLDAMIQDVEGLKHALTILETSNNKEEYIKKVIKGNCSRECYYS